MCFFHDSVRKRRGRPARSRPCPCRRDRTKGERARSLAPRAPHALVAGVGFLSSSSATRSSKAQAGSRGVRLHDARVAQSLGITATRCFLLRVIASNGPDGSRGPRGGCSRARWVVVRRSRQRPRRNRPRFASGPKRSSRAARAGRRPSSTESQRVSLKGRFSTLQRHHHQVRHQPDEHQAAATRNRIILEAAHHQRDVGRRRAPSLTPPRREPSTAIRR